MKKTSKSSYLDYPLIPVLLSGGSGTRLWPLSRESLPKQYLKINNLEYTLIQQTLTRIIGIKNKTEPIIICNEDQRFIVAEQMREIDVTPKSILLEPFGRNTAPAITLAALKALEEYKDAILLVLSADHQVKNSDEFVKSINNGINDAQKGKLVTFGIPPKTPETGYGYIESHEQLSNSLRSSKIKSFLEKPKKKIAEKLIEDKHYFWNSGMFLFKASSVINEISKFHPNIVNFCEESIKNASYDLFFQRIDPDSFSSCPNIPIDIAVMEKTNLGVVHLLDAEWSDIGTWESVWQNSKKDIKGNTLIGKSIARNTKNCYLRSENRLLVGIGLENLILVEADDSTLVLSKNSSQLVKEVVNDLKSKNYKEGKSNNEVYRPWGRYITIGAGDTWQVKRIEIKSKQSISLQLHNHRSEHWIVVKGTAKVEIDNKSFLINSNESIYVPLGAKHRLSNPKDEKLIIIEIQNGNYLGEDDIIRFEDKYGRS